MAKRKTQGVKYAGELAIPIVLPSWMVDQRPEDGSAAAFRELRRAFADLVPSTQRLNKLPLLFKHYGIDPKGKDCWPKLAMALAVDHVDGFRIAKRKGRKPSPKGAEFELWAEVRLLQIEGRHSVSRACALLAEHKRKEGKEVTGATLRRRFGAANKKYAKSFEDVSNEKAQLWLLQVVNAMQTRSSSAGRR